MDIPMRAAVSSTPPALNWGVCPECHRAIGSGSHICPPKTTAAVDSDPDMDEALRRARAPRTLVGAR